MADKNIKMQVRNDTNTAWDVLYPQTKIGNVIDYNTTTEGAMIHDANALTTPNDTDELPIVDTWASNVLKKVTWANIKARLKTYFDTLYGSSDLGKAQSVVLEANVKKGQTIEVYNNAGTLKGRVVKQAIKPLHGVSAGTGSGAAGYTAYTDKSGKNVIVIVNQTATASDTLYYLFSLIDGVWVQKGNGVFSTAGGSNYNKAPQEASYIDSLDAWAVGWYYKGAYWGYRFNIIKWDGTTFRNTNILDVNCGYSSSNVKNFCFKSIKGTAKVIGAVFHQTGSSAFAAAAYGWTITENGAGFTATPVTGNNTAITGITASNYPLDGHNSIQFGNKVLMPMTNSEAIILHLDTGTNTLTYAKQTINNISNLSASTNNATRMDYPFIDDNKAITYVNASGTYYKFVFTETGNSATGYTATSTASPADGATVTNVCPITYDRVAKKWYVKQDDGTYYTYDVNGTLANLGATYYDNAPGVSTIMDVYGSVRYRHYYSYFMQLGFPVFLGQYIANSLVNVGPFILDTSKTTGKYMIAQADGSNGGTITVAPLYGVVSSTGLTVLKNYVFDGTNIIAEGTGFGNPIGYATSTTNILVTTNTSL